MEKTKRRLGFFTKLLAYFLVVSLVPIGVLGLSIFVFSNYISTHKVYDELELTLESASSNVDSLLEDYKSSLTVFCEDGGLHKILEKGASSATELNTIYQKMYLLLAGRTAQLDMYVIKADNSFSITTNILPKAYNVSEFKWGIFRAASESEQAVVYPNQYVNSVGDKIAVSIIKVIKNGQGEILGYGIIDIPEYAIANALRMGNSFMTLNYVVMDEHQYVIYDEAFSAIKQPFFREQYKGLLEKNTSTIKKAEVKNTECMVRSKKGLYNDLIILGLAPIDLVVQNNNYITMMTMGLAIIATSFCFIASFMIARSVSRPIQKITKVMHLVEQGDMTARVGEYEKNELGFLAKGLDRMIGQIDELFKNNLEKQDRLRLAEIKNLQSQINPHFLYNTLDSIKWLAKLGRADEINTVVSKLGILLKNSIHNKKDIVTVRESIHIIESYLAIEQIRYSDKFETEILVHENILDYEVPKLIIQPIVENAIVHGIENKLGKCKLVITGYKQEENVIFEIKDDGIGMDETTVETINNNEKGNKESIGLQNINRRIKLYYGEEYGISVHSQLGEGTIVRVVMPTIGMGE